MEKIKIYHNPRCRKSREGLRYLQDKKLVTEVVDYIRKTLSPDEIKELLTFLGMKPFDLVRTEEDYYIKELKGKELSDQDWIKVLSEHPKLIKRPIVVRGNRAVFAQPASMIEKLL